jgi:hypothetical protein
MLSAQNHSSTPENPLLLQKGKYVFIKNLQEVYKEGSSVPFFSATAILIVEKEGELSGDIQTVNISDLILKQSSYIDQTGKTIEAHKLYTWPRNLGSTKEWSASKLEFLNQYVLNFPIEIISTQESNGITWKYITPENFKDFPEDIQGSATFQEFAGYKNEYFFLRRPLNEPK